MIGFEFFVYRADLIDDPKAAWPPERALLARWMAPGFRGLDWIEALVKAGTASYLGGNGYPVMFSAPAREVLALIEAGPAPYQGPPIFGEDYVLLPGAASPVTIDRAKVQACPPEAMLRIHAWDQS